MEPASKAITPLRLLPWTSPESKPCFLVTDREDGYLSRLADRTEAVQLATGADVLACARKVLDDPMSPHAELRYAGIRLAECLSDALRVAESRGLRLSARVTDIEEEDAGDIAGSSPSVPDDAESGGSR
ncbi:hypothetical protein K4749_30950 [Streptomyces sp. TRM72054]|uniref:hypothetical protein n=1 Tax=Streptomyces sp. TRM72054 TaxID=2870562 RepID=UPI001C8CB72C|nr:hypothetical protein [Streptomyces sp. TRM72054]MBX9397889.1 hypothetical protein [Streptomyces sp. TRM72054]